MRIVIGNASEECEALQLDLTKLVDTRLLVQGNSGAGKSWLLRLLAERAAQQIQTIILDPEGEFSTLREKVDCVLVGQGGELPADTRSASLLARKLMELQVSAVVDLYSLQLHDRRKFVKLFLESLLHLPRDLWHPCLIMLDESHKFCPERGSGDAESSSAVIDLMSQGRKRGLCGILATQRLSKLHKDAAAECNNVMIGRTWLDVDVKRATDLLGQNINLRDLPAGNFWAFGPALSLPGVVKFESDKVRTTHPEAGKRHQIVPPKPSAAIQKVVAQLTDLPAQAEEEVRTMDAAKKEITKLKQQVRYLESKPGAVDPSMTEKAAAAAVRAAQQDWAKQDQAHRRRTTALEKQLERVGAALVKVQELTSLNGSLPPMPEPLIALASHHAIQPVPPGDVRRPPAPRGAPRQPAADADAEVAPPRGGLRRMLIALAQRPQGLSSKQLGLRAGLSSKSGTYGTYCATGRSAGWIAGSRSGLMQITDTGLDVLGEYELLPTGPALLNYWLGKLGNSGTSRMLRALAEAYPSSLSKEELGELAGITPTSGTMGTYLSELRTLELISGPSSELRASEELCD